MRAETDPVQLLTEFISYPTVSNRPVTAIAASLAERAEDAGGSVSMLQSSEGKCNVVARFGPVSSRGIILSGHMDVVPTDGQQWSSDPFKLDARDGRLYGRGTADMKGFIAAVTAAIGSMPLDKLKRELVLMWTHDEEVGCLGSQILAERWANTLEPLPAQAWIGEPTDLKMCRMHPGHSTIEIHCTGRAAHSSRPGLGINAISLAQRVLAVLESTAEDWKTERAFSDHLVSPYTIMNIGRISGGNAVNIVPDSCAIHVGIRPLPGTDARQKIEDIEGRLNSVVQHARYLGGDIELRTHQIGPALLTPEGTRLEHALCPHSVQEHATAAPFATDGGNLEKMGISSIVFGPGSIDVAHRPDEFIETSELVKCVETVQQVIHTLCTEDDSVG